tara:strand:+ start:275 stop:790 length:516 start_codon:yes stop_codon:yes gene_type:complete
MSGIYGIDPFFTYTFDDESYNNSNDCREYDPSCLMSYLIQNHPKFASIVKNSKYYVGVFSDRQYRGTIFIPNEKSIPESLMNNMDINFSRRFIDAHSMEGFFPKTVLMTSPYQQLQSRTKGQMITAAMYQVPSLQNKISLILNDSAVIEKFDIKTDNAFVHIISQPIPFIF